MGKVYFDLSKCSRNNRTQGQKLKKAHADLKNMVNSMHLWRFECQRQFHCRDDFLPFRMFWLRFLGVTLKQFLALGCSHRGAHILGSLHLLLKSVHASLDAWSCTCFFTHVPCWQPWSVYHGFFIPHGWSSAGFLLFNLFKMLPGCQKACILYEKCSPYYPWWSRIECIMRRMYAWTWKLHLIAEVFYRFCRQ